MQWERYAEAIILKRLKPRPYIFDQLKHIISVASGYYPAFAPLNDDEEFIPSKELKRVIMDEYGL